MTQDIKKLIIGTISVVLAILFFSGALSNVLGGVFDFNKLAGSYPDWLKNGGAGAKGGFLFALTLIPSVMFAIAMITIFEHYWALFAASKLLNPILKPLIGIPGSAAISLIASLQSADAGSSSAKMLKDENKITYKELLTFAAFQFSGGAMLTNFLSSLAPLLVSLSDEGGRTAPATIGLCLGIILVFKVVGANVIRLYVKFFVK